MIYIFDFDGTLRESTGKYPFPIKPEEVKIMSNTKEVLSKLKQPILGVSNQSAIAKNYATKEKIIECFHKTCELLDIKIDFYFCPHEEKDNCKCRKPKPYFGELIVKKYNLKPKDCMFVGDMKTDQEFASNCGFEFSWAKAFFHRR